MKRILVILSFVVIVLLIILNSYEIMENIKFSFYICINNLFPALIPFMLLSNIIINYDFVNDLSEIFKPIMNKIFKVNENSSFPFIMSIFSGTPSNAFFLKDSLKNNLIYIDDVQKCLNFCHFTNPIFIIGSIGITFFNNKKMGLIILVSHYLSSIIIGILQKNNKTTYKYKHIIKKEKNSFIKILSESINSIVGTLFLILGIITTFLILTTIIDSIISLNYNYKFIYGILEITQGLKYLSLSNLNIEVKAILASAIISFGGFCIHAQVLSIIDNKKIRYLPYFISRIFHSIISAILTYLIIKAFY